MKFYTIDSTQTAFHNSQVDGYSEANEDDDNDMRRALDEVIVMPLFGQ